MKALLIMVESPFHAARSLQVLRRGRRIRALAPTWRTPHIAFLNGRPVLRAAWRRRLRDGDVLIFVALPAGGGGGGSNPLRVLAALALLVLAPQIAGFVLGPTATAAAQGAVLIGEFTVFQAATVAVAVAGQALLNVLMPPPGLMPPAAVPTPSAQYRLAAQGNTARLEQAIPVQYGRVLTWPDFAAVPYSEFAGNEQYLFQLLCLGAGDYEVEQIRIEDTPIDQFSEVEVEIVPPGARITLFPAEVATALEVSGQELVLRSDATFSQAGSLITVTEPGHARAVGDAVILAVGGALAGARIAIRIQTVAANTWTAQSAETLPGGAGACTVHQLVGGIDGIIANAAGTQTRRIGVDIGFPLGLYRVDDGPERGMRTKVQVPVFEARRVDDDGTALGDWIQVFTQRIEMRTTSPVWRSYVIDLPAAGRWAVRGFTEAGRFSNPKEDVAWQMIWSGLRAYLEEDADYGNVTLIAMRLKATNNLSLQASRRISVISTRKVPIWNGTTWSEPVATRSIAWAIADAARNADVGAGLPDAQIDLPGLLALDALWTARGDAFDGQFRDAASWWEAVGRIALAGRARAFLQGGQLRVVRDGPDMTPVALFSMRNIETGSLSVDYIMPGDDTADAVEVAYFDASVWQPRRVTATLPGAPAARPARIDLFGVTDRSQALREGLYQAASNRYRRRVVSFVTEMEGFIPSIGDVIAVQHDMPRWGQHAEAVGYNAANGRLRLTEALVWTPQAVHFISCRTRTGGLSGPWRAVQTPDAHVIRLPDTPDLDLALDGGLERAHVAFGPGADWGALARVMAVRPQGLYSVRIEAVIEDARVHNADRSASPIPIRRSRLAKAPAAPVVSGVIALRAYDAPDRIALAWKAAVGAVSYQVEVASGASQPAEQDWQRVADTTATNALLPAPYAQATAVRVRAIGLAAGPWETRTVGALLAPFWSGDTTAFWTTDSAPFWTYLDVEF